MSEGLIFVSEDTQQLQSAMTAAYEKLTGTTVKPASPEYQFIAWVTNIIILTRSGINFAANQNIPRYAQGKYMEALAELFHSVKRKEATYAKTTIRFHISEAQTSAVLIPAGTRVTTTDNKLSFATGKDAYIPIGALYADVAAVCQTAGAVGNGYLPGQISKIVDVFAYFSSCENRTTSAGGADTETDKELYERMRASQDTYSTAGSLGAYKYFAMSVSTEIADVVANSPSAGVVKLYVLMGDGTIAGSEIKDAVLKACSSDSVRPLTDNVSVADPEIVSYDITLTYYIPSDSTASAAETEAAVQAAVNEYKAWQSGKLGRDINPSQLVSKVMATGVKRTELNSPSYIALRDGSDGTVPQLAAAGAVTITNGGYEND